MLFFLCQYYHSKARVFNFLLSLSKHISQRLTNTQLRCPKVNCAIAEAKGVPCYITNVIGFQDSFQSSKI